MSSYRGAWDGGPPGAEAEYDRGRAPPAAAPPPAPATDPWTGVSYSQYPAYDYYGYGYNYDGATYYQQTTQRPENYYGKYNDPRGYTQQTYDGAQHSREHRPSDAPAYERKRYRSSSRSVSPYRRSRSYSRKKEGSYDSRGPRRSSKHRKYSSSDRSSSRSRSRSVSSKRGKRRRRASSATSGSDKSYKYKSSKKDSRDCSPSPRTHSPVWTLNTKNRSASRTPEDSRKGSKSSSIKNKGKRDVVTPPRRKKDSVSSPKSYKKSDRVSLTPPHNYKKSGRSVTPSNKYKRSDTPPLKESSLTPPKCYARGASSSSKSHSLSASPRRRKKNCSRSRRSVSHSTNSSHSSRSSRSSRHKSKRKTNRSVSNDRTPKSHSRHSRSTSRRRSKDRGMKRSVSKGSWSHSRSSRSHSRSNGSSSDEDRRRGQFTVADRKRFWKLHKSKQEGRERTPPKEVKPPPGAIETAHVDDIEYGDPPEVEGPNFAELLPLQNPQDAASSSKKPLPLPIRNDGSFLEMFKKMQEATKKAEEAEKKPEIKKPVLPFIGKRRGGRVLKTGLVKKAKAIDEQSAEETPKDAWSLYMQEVKKYRETSCEEERKTRPLVK